MKNIFFKSVLCAGRGQTVAQCSLSSGMLVHLFVEVSGEAVFAGTATLSDARTLGKTALRRRLHSQVVACTEEFENVIICAPEN